MKIYVIGAGGVASYLLPVLNRSVNRGTTDIIIMDGDRLEERNLDRQLFSSSFVGMNKAEALADMYNVEYYPSYLREGSLLLLKEFEDWLFVAVDNHKARRVALGIADNNRGVQVLIGANEYTDSEAYYYEYGLRGTDLDPRVRWPEILTDTSNDPTSCQGVELVSSPQLAIANMLTAAYMMHLFYFYTVKSGGVSAALHPRHHHSNFAKMMTE